MEIKIHKHNNKLSIWENFKLNIKDPNNIREIIGALSVVNATLIGYQHDDNLIEKNMLQIVEFGDNFMKEFGKKTRKARFENWGREAFALRLYQDLKENAQFELHVLSKLEKATQDQKRKAVNIGNTICKIKGDKRVTICSQDGSYTLFFEKNMKNIKDELILTAILNDALSGNCGVIISRPNFDGTENIYGIRMDNYNIEVINKEELEWSYSIDAITGKKIKVPAHLRFKEFRCSSV